MTIPRRAVMRATAPRHARGAILIESLIALMLLSGSAAAMLIAFEQLEQTSRALCQLLADDRARSARAETAGPR